MNKRLVLITGFLFLITFGTIFSVVTNYDRYGWSYNVTTIVNNVESQSVEINLSNQIAFSMLFVVTTLLSLSLLIETKNA